MKPLSEMSTEEILKEIEALRERRQQRRESSAAGHTTRKDPTAARPTKAKRDKQVDTGLADMLSAILSGDITDQLTGDDDGTSSPSPEA